MIALSVVIVSWNVRELLQRCLESIQASEIQRVTEQPGTPNSGSPTSDLQVEIIVVDNGSTDGSVEMVRQNFPDVCLIANEENRGFPAANNQGIDVADGRYILLLNPDTEVLDDALATMVAFADAHPDAAIIGPRLVNPDGTVQSSRRRLPTLLTAVFESTWLEPWAPRRLLDHYRILDRPDDVIQDVDWGCDAGSARGR
jgi:hypothetical protein